MKAYFFLTIVYQLGLYATCNKTIKQNKIMESKKENQFIVDLGAMKLSPIQKDKINAAIQKAVAGQIASLNLKDQVALYPINKLPKGPIINGIIARPIGLDQLEKIIGH